MIEREEYEVLLRAAEAGAFSLALYETPAGERISNRMSPVASSLLGREVNPEEIACLRGQFYDAVWTHFDDEYPDEHIRAVPR